MICRAICHAIGHVDHRQPHDQLIKTPSWLMKTSIMCRALVNVLFLKFSALQLSLQSFAPPPSPPPPPTHKALLSLFFPTNFIKDGLITVVSWFIHILEVRICFDLSAAIPLSTYAWVVKKPPPRPPRDETMCESNALRFVIRYCYRKLDGKWKNFANLVSSQSRDISRHND